MLHGIREGTIATDRARRVTLVNDEARRLLGARGTRSAATARELVPAGPRARGACRATSTGPDRSSRGRPRARRQPHAGRPCAADVGAVVTLRDRTELEALLRELNDVREPRGRAARAGARVRAPAARPRGAARASGATTMRSADPERDARPPGARRVDRRQCRRPDARRRCCSARRRSRASAASSSASPRTRRCPSARRTRTARDRRRQPDRQRARLGRAARRRLDGGRDLRRGRECFSCACRQRPGVDPRHRRRDLHGRVHDEGRAPERPTRARPRAGQPGGAPTRSVAVENDSGAVFTVSSRTMPWRSTSHDSHADRRRRRDDGVDPPLLRRARRRVRGRGRSA